MGLQDNKRGGLDIHARTAHPLAAGHQPPASPALHRGLGTQAKTKLPVAVETLRPLCRLPTWDAWWLVGWHVVFRSAEVRGMRSGHVPHQQQGLESRARPVW